MAFQKGCAPGPGRPRGSTDRFVKARAAFFSVFDKMGEPALLAFAKKDPATFYRVIASLLPKEITGPDGGPIEHSVSGSISIDLDGARRAFNGTHPMLRPVDSEEETMVM